MARTRIEYPSDEEEQRIDEGIAADADAYVATDEEWRTMTQRVRSPTEEEDRQITEDALRDPHNPPLDDETLARMRRVRGPQKAPTKERVGLRLDADVVAHFRAQGPGWQQRINAALRAAAGL